MSFVMEPPSTSSAKVANGGVVAEGLKKKFGNFQILFLLNESSIRSVVSRNAFFML